MANTYTQMLTQFVFAVKGRENWITTDAKDSIEKYIVGIAQSLECNVLAIYCNPDHCHILVGMTPTISPSKFMQKIKGNSSKWINDCNLLNGGFAWQTGFGAFNYSQSHKDRVVKYILNQEKHHKTESFQTEYIKFLESFQVQYNDQYLFDYD
ncbi:MAG: IS200/IS605 family transposase [Mangrovibacterium sp.]